MEVILATAGFVIEGEKGNFLDAGNRWREIPVSRAHVHPPEAIEAIREAFHYCRSKPRCMYKALRTSEGITLLLDDNAISFYVVVAARDAHSLIGDCAHLTA